MRAITPAIAEQLAAQRVSVALLAELDTQPEPVRAWTGIGNLTWAGKTFVGVGHLGGISPIRETAAEVRANGVTFQLSGIPSELLAVALTTHYQGRPARLWLGFLSSGYREQVLADAPLAYWRLGETSGTVAADSSGHGHDGTYENGVVQGVEGLLVDDADLAAQFDGVDDRVVIPSAAGSALNFVGFAPFSIEVLLKYDATQPAHGIIFGRSFSDAGGLQGYVLWLRSDKQVVFTRWKDFATRPREDVTSPTLTAGQTYHVVATFDGTTMRLYLNGVEVGTPKVSVNDMVSGGTQAWIGARGLLDPFKGILDEVAVYDYALSPARIRAHYEAGRGAFGTLPQYLVADPVLLFSGRMDVMAIDEGAETSTITVSAESRLTDLTRLRERRYTDEDQRQLFPGDRGLEYVAGLQKKLDTMQWANNKVQFFPVTVGEPGAA